MSSCSLPLRRDQTRCGAWLNDREVDTQFYAADAATFVAELTIEDGLHRHQQPGMSGL